MLMKNKLKKLSIVIPCYDEPYPERTWMSLVTCEKPEVEVEVVWVINHGEGEEFAVQERNRFTLIKLMDLSQQEESQWIHWEIIPAFNLPAKQAGVGLARKIGMDWVCERLEKSNLSNQPIVCLDADCTVQPNYLIALEEAFTLHPNWTGASIEFKHPIYGEEFEQEVYRGIFLYEQFLRYYIAGLRWAGHPFAFQTIGSAMAVRSDIYRKQGGMNKRKAGEDFYFLNKIIPLGNFLEITSTSVIPSPRPSHRVPFGTGKAIGKYLESKEILFYNPLLFELLKSTWNYLSLQFAAKNEDLGMDFETLDPTIREFLNSLAWKKNLEEINANVNSRENYIIRMFRWFDLFLVLKFVHFYQSKHLNDLSWEELNRIPLPFKF